MLVASVLALAGLAMLTLAADHLVLGSSRVAARLRVSPVVVGVIVIGLGTSAPEFLVSGLAAARGDDGIAVGNIVGSNIINLTLILGVAALIGTVTVTATVIRREAGLAVVGVAAFAVAAWIGLSPVTGAILGVLAVAALGLLLRWAGQEREQNRVVAEAATGFTKDRPTTGPEAAGPPPEPPVTWFEPVRALLGLGFVLLGAHLLVTNAASIAERLGVPQIIIGFTLVALGTSLPELVTAIAAQRRGQTALVVGNLFGSNLLNSLAGGAVVGVASGAAAPDRPALALLAAMVVATVVAWVLLWHRLNLNRVDGTVLLAVYLGTTPLLLAS